MGLGVCVLCRPICIFYMYMYVCLCIILYVYIHYFINITDTVDSTLHHSTRIVLRCLFQLETFASRKEVMTTVYDGHPKTCDVKREQWLPQWHLLKLLICRVLLHTWL